MTTVVLTAPPYEMFRHLKASSSPSSQEKLVCGQIEVSTELLSYYTTLHLEYTYNCGLER